MCNSLSCMESVSCPAVLNRPIDSPLPTMENFSTICVHTHQYFEEAFGCSLRYAPSIYYNLKHWRTMRFLNHLSHVMDVDWWISASKWYLEFVLHFLYIAPAFILDRKWIIFYCLVHFTTDRCLSTILISYRQLHPRHDVSSGDTRAAHDKCIGFRRRQWNMRKNRTSSPIRISRLFGSTDAGIKSAAIIRFDLNQHHQVCGSLISGMMRWWRYLPWSQEWIDKLSHVTLFPICCVPMNGLSHGLGYRNLVAYRSS